mmetsp:Transcript_80648/g.118283  ORF Transcript_80648/g.118283 Transcript_80648/m.118283 type:complete len:247 (-) Transcript_80648:59-799(-)
MMGTCIRALCKVNHYYWSHVWFLVAGWRTAYSAVAACEVQGPQIKYCYGAMVMFLFSAWQRRMVSVLVPFLFAVSSSPVKYAYAAITSLWYVWQRKKGHSKALVSIATPFLCGFLMRFLLLVAGPHYTFVFLGVTQTPLIWAFGERFPTESALLERSLTPIFIVVLVLVKEMDFKVFSFVPAGISESNMDKRKDMRTTSSCLSDTHTHTHARTHTHTYSGDVVDTYDLFEGTIIGFPFRLFCATFL